MDTSNPIDPWDKSLSAERMRAKGLCDSLNAIPAHQMKVRKSLYQSLFGRVSTAYIEPNFYCDYGSKTFLGERFYANHNCVFLDGGGIYIGDRVLLGPNVQIYTVNHPLDAELRATGLEYGAAVHIGDDCWIGGGAILMPGVRIGKGCVIGAGSVVTKDLPDYSLALGNPARVTQDLTPNAQ